MPHVLVTAPSVEPVVFDPDLKEHLRLPDSSEQTKVEGLVTAARAFLEDIANRAFVTQTWDLFLDRFPSCILVPRPRLQSVTTIKYRDTDGQQVTLDSSKYQVDIKSEPGRIIPVYGETWPSTRAELNAVEVRYVAGYGDAAADVDASAKHLIKILVSEYFENPDGMTIANVKPLLNAYRALLNRIRVRM
jgi:uncharacterized phiE125 gp8 family phage protein